jgi:hypothetical protein
VIERRLLDVRGARKKTERWFLDALLLVRCVRMEIGRPNALNKALPFSLDRSKFGPASLLSGQGLCINFVV